MIRQYEHLKKKYVKNLFDMLAENYQIPIPKETETTTETEKEVA